MSNAEEEKKKAHKKHVIKETEVEGCRAGDRVTQKAEWSVLVFAVNYDCERGTSCVAQHHKYLVIHSKSEKKRKKKGYHVCFCFSPSYYQKTKPKTAGLEFLSKKRWQNRNWEMCSILERQICFGTHNSLIFQISLNYFSTINKTFTAAETEQKMSSNFSHGCMCFRDNKTVSFMTL